MAKIQGQDNILLYLVQNNWPKNYPTLILYKYLQDFEERRLEIRCFPQ